jgi:hypothetical protein
MVSSGTMASASGSPERRDGVRVTRTRGVPRDLWAAVVVAAAVLTGWWVLRAGAPVAPPPVASAPPLAPATAPPPAAIAQAPAAAAPTLPTTRGAKLRALRKAGIKPQRGPSGRREIDAAPVIDALKRAGVEDGIAAFPPPGTDPPRSGVLVPDDWVLPEGYVRHEQTTDDGETLPPILMFHPDYEFTDEAGNPIAMPEDRVVPPDLVPPGFPVEMLDVPRRRR